jgi:hypothetical protein
VNEPYEIDPAEIPEPDPSIYELTVKELDLNALPDEPEEVSELVEGLTATVTSLSGAAAVKIARGQSGVAESGGEDCGVPHERYVKHFGANLGPLPWCAFFVSWCFDKAGRRPPWRNPGYVGSVREWAQANGHIVGRPGHGDMFGLGDHHMGLVAGADPDKGQIYTIEGNYSDRVGARLMNYKAEGAWFARL